MNANLTPTKRLDDYRKTLNSQQTDLLEQALADYYVMSGVDALANTKTRISELDAAYDSNEIKRLAADITRITDDDAYYYINDDGRLQPLDNDMVDDVIDYVRDGTNGFI